MHELESFTDNIRDGEEMVVISYSIFNTTVNGGEEFLGRVKYGEDGFFLNPDFFSNVYDWLKLGAQVQRLSFSRPVSGGLADTATSYA
ncbi:hypothetical protein A2U01_0061416 [Trifolium medium]|uniref:Uncharacterized protein n=1 Tax=Trifolium medium TaxID=97028 RepID=A0A392RVV0_9FABA|nr:hypothetical protein [Trifolium medium]